MPYSYFDNLSARQQKTYLSSDRITDVSLRNARRLRPRAESVEKALATQKPGPVQEALDRLCKGLTEDLGVPAVEVRVLARRPSKHGEELHGLYVAEEGKPALITVWMRTSAKKNVVTYRTFMRTFLHEVCHHLDYHLYKLRDTFHTEGFFKRESSLMRSLVPKATRKPKPEKKTPANPKRPEEQSTARGKRPDPRKVPEPAGEDQLKLFDL